jgi:DNA-binding XRE family transcriptional regulator
MHDVEHFRALMRTPEKRSEHVAIREWFQKYRPTPGQHLGTEPFSPDVSFDGYVAGRQIVLLLVRAREAAGLSLADVAERSGIDKAAFSRLENGVTANPTVDTLMRYAAAVGKRLTWSLQDLPAPTG